MATFALGAAQNVITMVDTSGIAVLGSSAALGADDLPIIAYFDRVTGNLKIAKCGNAGCSSGNIYTAVDTAGYSGRYSSIALAADGLPVIAYSDETKLDLKVMKCGDASCTADNSFATVDSSGFEVGIFPSLAIPQDGLPVMAYYELENVDQVTYLVYLRVTKCGNASCTSGNTTRRVDSLGPMVSLWDYHTSIAVPADGLPVISYFNDGENDLKVLKCGNSDCSSGNIATAVDTSGYAGIYSSLKVPADGLPVISYFGRALKLVKCGNASCSSGNSITRVDDGGEVPMGGYTSLAVSADGLPVIGHRDMSNGDLRVVKCGNATCTAGKIVTMVDTAGKVGRHITLAVPSDGLPIISYYDETKEALKVLKCSRPDCSATTPILRHHPRPELSPLALAGNGKLMLHFRNPGRVQVFDILGNSKFEAAVPSPRHLEVPGLKPGVHIVQWTSTEGVLTQKVSILP